MAEAASTALHVTSQGTLVSASSSLEVRIVAAGGATLHESVGVRPPLQYRRIARCEVVKQVSRNSFDGGVLVFE